MTHHNKLNKGFTLVELIISMTLFVLVAAVVLAFILSMSNFAKKNNNEVTRLEQLTALRKEVDKWFSVMDSKCQYSENVFKTTGFDVTETENEKKEPIVCFVEMEPVGIHNYWMYFLTEDDDKGETQRYVVFDYGDGKTVKINASTIRTIVFDEFFDEYPNNYPLRDDYSFEVTTHVRPTTYKCVVTYNELP